MAGRVGARASMAEAEYCTREAKRFLMDSISMALRMATAAWEARDRTRLCTSSVKGITCPFSFHGVDELKHADVFPAMIRMGTTSNGPRPVIRCAGRNHN